MRLAESLICGLREGRIGGADPAQRLDEFIGRLPRAEDGRRRVLVAERDPARMLAAFAAALAGGHDVFLADPRWAESEWREVGRLLAPDYVFGDSPLEAREAGGGESRGAEESRIAIPTGGTGGRVRFAVHTEATLAAAAEGMHRFFGGGPSNWVSELPLFHVSGLMPVIRAAWGGGRFVRDAAEDAGTLRSGNAVLSLVPTQLARVLGRVSGKSDHADRLERLRCFSAILIGGAPLSESLRKRARRERLPLAPSYGMTETAAAVCVVRPEAFLEGDDSSGTPLPHARVTVEGADAGRREGRLMIEASSLFIGYYGERASIARPWPSEDTGRLDERGRLFVTGRIRPAINTGGEKVAPGEVERALVESGIAIEAYVAGVEDAEWGEAVVAVYVPAPGAPTEAGVLKARLGGALAAHKIPRRWVAAPAGLPRTEHGKLDMEKVKSMIADRHQGLMH